MDDENVRPILPEKLYKKIMNNVPGWLFIDKLERMYKAWEESK